MPVSIYEDIPFYVRGYVDNYFGAFTEPIFYDLLIIFISIFFLIFLFRVIFLIFKR